jgi:sugar/nucleoside kinase (ribokinase family)
MEAMMVRYLVFGHLTIDDTVFPDGRTAMGTAGGNVLYAAVGAHVWSDQVVMITRPGQGYPRHIIDDLAACGYLTDGLIPCESRRIRQWQLYDDEGGRHYVPLASSGSYADLTPRVEEIPPAVLPGAVGCHIAPLPITFQASLVTWARSQGLRVVLDPHHEDVHSRTAHLWQSILPSLDAFCPSQEEVTCLLDGWHGPEAAARMLADWGAAVICLKMGAQGVFVYRAADQASWLIPSLARHPVDITGCGDAFCGGFLVGWCETDDLQRAASYGTVSASFVAENFGARHALQVDRQEAMRRLALLTIQKVKASL